MAPPAQAAPPTITTVASAKTAAPGVNSRVIATADCGSVNNVVTGGGVSMTTSADGTMASSAQRVEGTGPGSASATFSTNNSTNAEFWIGADGTGTNNSDSNGGAIAFALCDNAKTYTGGTTIATASVNHPTSSTDFTPATVSCPANTHLLTGGALTTPQDGDLKVVGSYPSDVNGNPVANGATNPAYWSAMGDENGTQSDTTEVFAVCATNAVAATVEQAVSTGTTATDTHQAVDVQCPANTSLVGGGFAVDANPNLYSGTTAFSGSGNHGDHGIGSYPTNSSGVAWTSGAATGWTGVLHTGGMHNTTPTYAHTYAVCVS